jgi:hypothetical protein
MPVAIPALVGFLALISANLYAERKSTLEPLAFFHPHIELSDSDLRAFREGQSVARLIASEGPEIAVLATGLVEVESDRLADLFADPVSFRRGRHAPEIGVFSDPPVMADLAGLTVEERDIRDIADCRPGSCDVKLGTSEILRLQQTMERSGEGWRGSVEEEFKAIVLDRVHAYLERGLNGIEPYHSRPEPLDVAEEFAAILDRSPYLAGSYGELDAFLREFPNRDLPSGAEQLLYWVKEDLELKPVIRVVHVVIAPSTGPDAGEADLVVADKQVFATHYLNGALGLTTLIEGNGAKPSALTYVYRTRADLHGIVGAIIRPIVERRVRQHSEQLFELLLERIRAVAVARPSTEDH